MENSVPQELEQKIKKLLNNVSFSFPIVAVWLVAEKVCVKRTELLKNANFFLIHVKFEYFCTESASFGCWEACLRV